MGSDRCEHRGRAREAVLAVNDLGGEASRPAARTPGCNARGSKLGGPPPVGGRATVSSRGGDIGGG